MNMYMNMNTSASTSSFWNPLSSPEQQRLSSHDIPPPSPQNAQWDFFWNPFSSLDYYGYSYDRESVDNRSGVDDDIRGLRRVREEEGIPDLEEDDEPIETEPVRFQNHNPKATEDSRGRTEKACCNEEVKVEDVNEDDDDEFTDRCVSENEGDEKCVEAKQEQLKVEVSRGETKRNVVGVGKVQEMKNVVGVRADTNTPVFTVYVNRRPTSMAEVIKDLEDQFTTIREAAKEVSGLLEASRAQYTSSSSDHSAMKMLNPKALFRSGSSRSSSSRFLITSSGGSKDRGSEDIHK